MWDAMHPIKANTPARVFCVLFHYFCSHKYPSQRGNWLRLEENVLITVRNPYFDKTYKVQEDAKYVENAVHNVQMGNEPFIKLHDEDGNLVLINPANLASVEVHDED